MKLILARHGNTFNSSEEAVWLGGANDLPLVESGRQQAIALGSFLKRMDLVPSTIYTAPLKRTREFGAIIQELLTSPVHLETEESLREIDYGRWAGKSNAQIEKTFGKQTLEDWQQRSIWPQNADWAPGQEDVIAAVLGFSEKLVTRHEEDETVMAISSNGILRYFLMLVDGAFESHRKSKSLKMGTGHFSMLTYKDGRFELDFWNESPLKIAAE